jgi:hypothetical protein
MDILMPLKHICKALGPTRSFCRILQECRDKSNTCHSKCNQTGKACSLRRLKQASLGGGFFPVSIFIVVWIGYRNHLNWVWKDSSYVALELTIKSLFTANTKL